MEDRLRHLEIKVTKNESMLDNLIAERVETLHILKELVDKNNESAADLKSIWRGIKSLAWIGIPVLSLSTWSLTQIMKHYDAVNEDEYARINKLEVKLDLTNQQFDSRLDFLEKNRQETKNAKN